MALTTVRGVPNITLVFAQLCSEESGLRGLGLFSGSWRLRGGAGRVAVAHETAWTRPCAGRRGQVLEPLPLSGRSVRAAPVELFVTRHEVRPVGTQPVEEDLPHVAAQVQGDAADA